jgi:nucleoside-diphosphate-sugar epimerase
VTDPASLEAAAGGCEVVFHCATGGTTLEDARRINVEGTANVVRAAARAGVRRVVHVSSMAVHEPEGRELTEAAPLRTRGGPYAVSKAEAERAAVALAAEAGVELAIVRPTIVYGPASPMWTLGFFQRVKNEQLVLIGGGRGVLNLIYVDDLVDGLLLASSSPRAAGEAFLLSGAESQDWGGYVGALARMCGKPPPPSVSAHTARLRAAAALWYFRFTRRPPRLDEADLALMTGAPVVRIEKAHRLLGFEPRVSFAEGMARSEAWLREEGHLPRIGH